MFGYEKIMNPEQFFLQGGWIMIIPVLVPIILLVLSKKKLTQTEQEVTGKTKVTPTGGELPRWATLLTGLFVCF